MVGSEAAMRVKSRKPPAENLITSDDVTCAEFIRGADDRIGDQMRQMAGDREHQIMMLGRHDLDLGAERGPERAQLLRRRGIGALRRRQDAPAVDEEFGEAGIGAGMLGAGHRMRRHEMHARRQMRRHVPHHRALDRADVGDDRARLEMGRDFLRDRAAGADRDAEDHEIGILRRLPALVSTTRSTMPSSATRARRLRRARGGDDLVRQSLRPRGARDRAADQPEADQRDALEYAACAVTLPAMKSRKASTTSRLASSVPMVMRKRVRQLVIVQRAQHEAALGEEGVRIGRGLALVLREMDQHEIGHARRHLEAELADLFGQPVAPFLGVGLRHLLMRGVLDRGDRRQHRRRRDVERPADAVDRIDDMGRAEHPADPQRGQPVDLGEGVGHHGVLGGRDQLDADLVVVARHVVGIGGVQHQQHMRRQAGAQPLDLVERQIGAGRVVRVGEPDQLGARRHQLEDRIDVGGEVGLGRDDVDGAVRHRRDRIDQKAVGGRDRLVAVAEIGVRQQIEDLVGAGAADDAVGIEPEGAADRLAQHPRGAFRIVLQMRGHASCRPRSPSATGRTASRWPTA